ncbi:hypothetical protein J3R82DRAFT_3141 [Butyriboletus roseoflavus]|nr:hypothetical protein J3R82DRAFT_3141 [Butyriboletus roseoflavus]
MPATRLTSSIHGDGVSAIQNNRVTVQRTRWWETTYTAVNWDYPPSPAVCYDALLSRGASHSRFLRIAYLSTRRTPAPRSPTAPLSPTPTVSLDTSTTPTSPLTTAHLTSTTSLAGLPRDPAVRVPQVPSYPLSRTFMNVRPRFANLISHTLKRRKPQWPKPPHYHASLLRSPLSRRKGLFRAVLPPNKAVDFFRWDVLPGADVSLSAPCQERDRTRSSDVDACASLLVAESVLKPYEAAAGFFGWHGLGLDVIRRVQENYDEGVDDECSWIEGVEVCRLGLGQNGAGMNRSSGLRHQIDEVVVEEGRARWARTAEELVGPPGIALRWVVEDGRSGKVTTPSDPVRKDVDSRASSSISSTRGEVRWDLDIEFSPSRTSRSTSVSDEKRQMPPSGSMATVPGPSSSSKPELKMDSPPTWWYGPSPHRGPPPTPHLPLLRFPPPPSAQYGPPPLQFSPWFPPGRVASAQGHGYWYGAQPTGAPPPMNRDPNLPNSLPPHSHIFTTPVTPTSMHPSQSPRHPTKPRLGQDEYGPGHDCDKETETDHGYESTTTTTDSDPPPHTPIGATTMSHCVEALQVHGDDDDGVHGLEIDMGHTSAAISLSDPTTPVKLLGGFTMSTSPSASSGSPGSNRDGCGSSKAAVVFPSLNGSFCQGSLSQMSVSLSSRGMSAQTTPARTVTPVSSSSLSSAKESMTRFRLGGDDNSKIELKSGGACSVSGDNPAFMLSFCSPLTSPNLRKDHQGFWEPVVPVSPSSSSSSLPLSPSAGKVGSRPTAGWIGDKTGPVLGESTESSGAPSLQYTPSAKSRSLSPGPRRLTSAGSTRSSSSGPVSFSSPTSTPASTSVFGGSHPPSPSPTNNLSLVPPNPTTLLPAFLATATVKRKKASRTREIVDRLRSSSIDAGKGGVGLDNLGWLAGPNAGGELDGTPGKASSESDHSAGNHVARGQPSPSPPSKSSSDSASWLGSDLGKNQGQAPGSKSSDSGSSGSGGKSNGAIQVATPGSVTLFSASSPGTVTTSANSSITPFPILSVSQTLASNVTKTQQSQNGGTTGREPAAATSSNGGAGPKMNATVTTSPNARSSGLLPSTPNGGTSPSAHHSHHPLPSLSHPTPHPQPPLGPTPPILTVSPYPHPMYVPFTQYHIAPPHQGQGTWLAVYPGHPPHLPAHPLPVQTHVAPITVRSQYNSAHFPLERPLGSSLPPPFEPNPILMIPKDRSRATYPPTNTTGRQGTSTLPLITITDVTPQKTSLPQSLSVLSTPTPTLTSDTPTPASSGKATDPYRLLYRGALSLPDSYLQLDGLAFSARLPNRQLSAVQDSPSCSLSESSARELMHNPLALALESMRGRQSLRFKGTVCLQDVWLDDTGDVYMDIHPFATLTRSYFENILCLSPLVAPTHDTFGPTRTQVGVRVSLGDTDGPETTDIVIYGETSTLLCPPPLPLSPAATSSSAGTPPLSMRVARITPAPRAPRPDDPTPRQPPAHLFGNTPLGDLGANKRIISRPNTGKARERVKDKEKMDEQVLRRARDVMLNLPRSKIPTNGSSKAKDRRVRGGAHQQSQRDAVFKAPELPATVRRKQGEAGTDVFGAVEPPQPQSANGKGKGKATVVNREDGGIGNAIEGANKLVLKKLAVHHLANAGISRSHSEFKDIFGFVYRGASFSLRSQLKTLHLSAQSAEAFVEAHVKMYVLNSGGAHDTPGLRRKTLNTMDVDDAGG